MMYTVNSIHKADCRNSSEKAVKSTETVLKKQCKLKKSRLETKYFQHNSNITFSQHRFGIYTWKCIQCLSFKFQNNDPCMKMIIWGSGAYYLFNKNNNNNYNYTCFIRGYDLVRIELLHAIFVILNSLNYFASPQDDCKYMVMAQM